MTDTPVRVSDDLRRRLDETFTPRQQVALVNAITWENSRARFNRAFDLGAEGYDRHANESTGALEP